MANTIIPFSLEQEICNGLSHSKQNSADCCSSDIVAFVRIPWQCSAYTRLRLCVLNATCLPHDGADGGERADALLGVRPVEKHVGAVEEVRHRQLHEHVVEGHLSGRAGGAFSSWSDAMSRQPVDFVFTEDQTLLFAGTCFSISTHLFDQFRELGPVHRLIGADLRFVLAKRLDG